MEDIIKSVNGLPIIIKLLLCIPCIEIIYGVCRVINGICKNDVLWLVLGILTIIPGACFMWIVDLVWVLFKGHAILLGETYFG